MCGISGFFAPRSLPGAGGILRTMNTALAHRGPDDSGYWLGNAQGGASYADGASHPQMASSMAALADEMEASIGLAHRRLSIIDLSSDGHQPMLLAERYVLSFNGEIYNYLELRQQLEAQGLAFKTATDVEVLLQMWATYGLAGLEKLEGMWAFALYDRFENELFLVRDRVGVKPLYYVQKNEAIFFASEPKALLAAGVCTTKLNEAALYAFLLHGAYEEQEGSLLADLKEVPPGHYLHIDGNNQPSLRAYHQAAYTDSWSATPPPAPLLNDIKNRLEHSVNLRLRSDVRVGASLSGGLDSSVLSLLAAKDAGFPLFTASYAHFEGDESIYAQRIAEQSKGQWNQVWLDSEQIAQQLHHLVRAMDGPLLAFSTFSQHEIYRAAKAEGVTILLDGQGGDELFSGYDRYWQNYQLQAIRNGQWNWFSKHPVSGLQFHHLWKCIVQELASKILGSSTASLLLKAQLKRSKLEYAFLRTDFKEKYLVVSAKRIKGNLNGLNAQLAHERYGHALKNLLRWGDRNSMAFGMENRAPLADDPQLDALLLQLPANWKMHPQVGSKYLLKQAMANALPSIIMERTDKVGFSAPTIPWMNALWPIWQENLVHIQQWVDVASVKKQAPVLLQSEWGCLSLLRMVSLGAWLKQLAEQHTR